MQQDKHRGLVAGTKPNRISDGEGTKGNGVLSDKRFAGNKSRPENICTNCAWQLDLHAAADYRCPMPDEILAHHWRERGWGGHR